LQGIRGPKEWPEEGQKEGRVPKLSEKDVQREYLDIAKEGEAPKKPRKDRQRLVDLIRTQGSVILQGISRPGGNVLTATASEKGPTVSEIEKFIDKRLGPSSDSIHDEIRKLYRGGRADLTAEDVERVKELIRKVGKLEFRIVANMADDHEGI